MSKRVLITGGNSGIGLCTAEQLAARGAEVILACRDQAKGQAALARIKHNSPDARVRVVSLDLADLNRVRGVAGQLNDELDGLDVLINNAGVVPRRQQFTADGFEMQFGVNYLAPVLLTHLLLPLLQQRSGARVVHVASVAHWLGRINPGTWRGRRPYLMLDAYGQSKLANILFSDVLAQRLAAQDITSNALHPGGVDTPIFRYTPELLMKAIRPTLTTPENAARLPVSLALDDRYNGVTGGYFDAKGPAARSPRARNKASGEKLYRESMKLLGINPL